jgi:hypothetical protein
MADSDYQSMLLRVGVVPGDMSGLDQAQGGLDGLAEKAGGVGEKAGEAEKGIGRMIREAGTIREAQRISQGFFDVFLGGGRTIEGAAEIMRFFIATAADINPIFATLAVVGASIAVVAGRQAEHNDKMKEGAQDAPAFADAIERAQERVRAAYELTEKQREKQQALYEQQAKAAEAMASAMERQVDAQKKLTDEMLRNAEATALANNKDGPAGADAIKAQFDTIHDRANAAADLEKIEIERTENIGQQQGLGAQIKTKQGELSQDQQTQADLQANRDRTAKFASAFGYSVGQNLGPEEQTKAWEKIRDEATAAEARALDAYKAAQDDVYKWEHMPFGQATALDPEGFQRADARRVLASTGQQLIESTEGVSATSKAGAAQAAYADPNTGYLALQDKIDKNTLALTDLQNKLQGLVDALATLGTERDARIAQAKGDDDAAKLKAQQAAVGQQDKDFKAKNDAAIAAQEQIAGDTGKTQQERQAALSQANDLRNAALQRQIDEGTGAGDFKGYKPENGGLSADQAQALRDQITANNTALAEKIRDQGDKDRGVPEAGKPQYDEASARLSDLVAGLEARVGGSNNADLQNLLKVAPDDRSRGQLLVGEYGDASDPKVRDMAQQIAAAMKDQDTAKSLDLKGGDVGAYDAAVGRQADIISKIGATASADGFQKLVDAVMSHADTQTKINAIILEATTKTGTILPNLAAQLQRAQAAIAALTQAHHDKTAYPNNTN